MCWVHCWSCIGSLQKSLSANGQLSNEKRSRNQVHLSLAEGGCQCGRLVNGINDKFDVAPTESQTEVELYGLSCVRIEIVHECISKKCYGSNKRW